ncbi:hypothetical protein TNCV_609711 [Trichonephila clavipes]|nr:hypothetical protein TNCV_609711 [Trichonephila clavipes]
MVCRNRSLEQLIFSTALVRQLIAGYSSRKRKGRSASFQAKRRCVVADDVRLASVGNLALVLFTYAAFLDGCCISFKVRAKMLSVDNLNKFVLFCPGIDVVAHGPDWADNHKWFFENGRKFVISLFRPVVQYEISSLEGMGSGMEIKSLLVL